MTFMRNARKIDPMKTEKTNVCRLLDAAKAEYEFFDYSDTDAVSGLEIAAVLKEDPDRVFKTLVTVGASKKNYVFMVPVAAELNLKKAAKAVSEKSIEMIKAKELLPLTGYIHGGCSPIGMKKPFLTVIDETSILFDKIYFSAGKVGCQVYCDPKVIEGFVELRIADVID